MAWLDAECALKAAQELLTQTDKETIKSLSHRVDKFLNDNRPAVEEYLEKLPSIDDPILSNALMELVQKYEAVAEVMRSVQLE